MLLQTLRNAHNEALRQLQIIDICTEEISAIRKGMAVSPESFDKLSIEFYEEKKRDAIRAYTEQMQSIIEPVMLRS